MTNPDLTETRATTLATTLATSSGDTSLVDLLIESATLGDPADYGPVLAGALRVLTGILETALVATDSADLPMRLLLLAVRDGIDLGRLDGGA